MSKLKILVVEDEPLIAEHLVCNLGDLGYDVVGMAHDYEEAIEFLESKEIDFLVLDIKLGGERTGIDLARLINAKYRLPFIFLTSYSDNDTLKNAKEVEPLGYLVKPIDEKDLLTTIEVALFNYEKKLVQNDRLTDQLSDTLFIKHKGIFEKVVIKEIIRVEAQDNYSLIFTEKKKYLMCNTLKLVEERLTPWSFMRVHRSHLINPQFISHLEDGTVFVNEQAIPISRKYKSEVFDRLNIF